MLQNRRSGMTQPKCQVDGVEDTEERKTLEEETKEVVVERGVVERR